MAVSMAVSMVALLVASMAERKDEVMVVLMAGKSVE